MFGIFGRRKSGKETKEELLATFMSRSPEVSIQQPLITPHGMIWHPSQLPEKLEPLIVDLIGMLDSKKLVPAEYRGLNPEDVWKFCLKTDFRGDFEETISFQPESRRARDALQTIYLLPKISFRERYLSGLSLGKEPEEVVKYHREMERYKRMGVFG